MHRIPVKLALFVALSTGLFGQVPPVTGLTAEIGPNHLNHPLVGADYLGIGFNSITGKLAQDKCVEFEGTIGGAGGGQKTSYNKLDIKRQEDIYQSLGVSLALSFKFIGGDANTSLTYAKTFKSSRAEQTLGINMTVQNLESRGYTPSLTMAALAAANESKQTFLAACGDSFVLAATTGGVLNIFATFKSQTSSDETTSKSTIGGNVGSGSGSFSLTQDFRKAIAESQASVAIYRNGSKDALPADKDLEAYALNFPPSVQAGSGEVLLSFEQGDYSAVQGFPSSASLSLSTQKSWLENVARRKLQQQGIVDQIDTLTAEPWKFAPFDATVVQAARAKASAAVTSFETLAQQCIDKLPDPCPSANAVEEAGPLIFPAWKYSAKLYAGSSAGNFSMISTDPKVRGLPTTLIGYALSEPRDQSDLPLYVGGSQSPCEATRVYGGVYNPCQSLLGYARSDAMAGSIPLYLGRLHNVNESVVNTSPSFGLAGWANVQCTATKPVGIFSPWLCSPYGYSAQQ